MPNNICRRYSVDSLMMPNLSNLYFIGIGIRFGVFTFGGMR